MRLARTYGVPSQPEAGLARLPAATSALIEGRATGQVNQVRTSSSCVTTAARTEQDELVERDVLRRLPRLAPHLVPAPEHARVAMAALAVLDRDPAREDRAGLLEPLAHLPQHRGVEAELALQLLDGARTGGPQLT